MLTRIIAIFIVVCIFIFIAIITTQSQSPSFNGEVMLYLTAVGDNGMEGIATSYDVRYSNDTITDGNWNQATRYFNTFTPKASGQAESLLVRNLPSDRYFFFAVKACDEVPLCGLSIHHSVRKKSSDGDAPANIIDVR